MHLHLYRPVMLRRAGRCVCIHDPEIISPREAALLVALKWATKIQNFPNNHGDPMSDDRSSSLKLVTAPASEPITLANAKLFLRIEHSADDEVVTRTITAARQAAEQYLKTALLSQTWDYVVANPCGRTVTLPYGPAQSITSITLTNEAGTSTVMNVANYRLSVDGFAVHFTDAQSIEKLTVRFVAGIATVIADIPITIIQGMLHHIAVMMETRDGAAPMPMQAVACYQPYRRISL